MQVKMAILTVQYGYMPHNNQVSCSSPYLCVIIAQREKVGAGSTTATTLCLQATHLLLGAAFGEAGDCALGNL